MARSTASFNRPKSRFKPQPVVLVICEDSKSGKRYLEDATLHFRVKVSVEIVHCGKTDPLNIVHEAIARQGKYDRVFCVIDRDSHETFKQALAVVKAYKKIALIVSYPCFEFWLLLHFGYNRKPFAAVGKHSAADLVIKELRAISGFDGYDKGKEQSIFNLLLPDKFNEVRKIAPRVLDDAKASGEMNPSTQLHELMDYFESLSNPVKVS